MNWTKEDREELAEKVADAMVSQMTFEDMRRCVWDMLYDELVSEKWGDLVMQAQEYVPEMFEDG